MALQSINPVRPREKESTLDKILKGVQLAAGITGVATDVNKLIKGTPEDQSTNIDLAKTRLEFGQDMEPVAPQDAVMPGREGLSGADITTDEVKGGGPGEITGMARTFQEPKEATLKQGVRYIDEPALGIKGFYQPNRSALLSEVEKERLKDIYRDFVPAEKGEEGAQDFIVGNERVTVKPKPGSETSDRISKRTDALRKEYTKASNAFESQTDSFARVAASASEPSAAGDLALIFNYMKILDPGSVVRESEFANAAASGSLPARVQAAANKVYSGQRLSDPMRKDFVGRAKKLYEAAKKRHAGRVEFYSSVAEDEGLNPRKIIVPIDVRPIDRDSYRKEMRQLAEEFKKQPIPPPAPETKIVDGVLFQKVPGGWERVE